MPRKSTKENKNIYFQKREELGLTREAASRLFTDYPIPPEAIEKIENERRQPYPAEVMEMAEKYDSPELCNHYCSRECIIGRKYIPEISVKEFSQIILEIIAALNAVRKQQDRLIEIAADGQVHSDELKDFTDIQHNLEQISLTVNALRLWSEQTHITVEYGMNRREYQ